MGQTTTMVLWSSAVGRVYALLLGAALGSFANVCVYRIPRGESIVRPRSRCPRCGAAIEWFRNIPVVSYAALRGRCARCGRPIPPRYVVVEILTAVLCAGAAWREPIGIGLVWAAALTFVLVAV